MTPLMLATPVALSYVAALRGIVPRQPGAPFTYALAACQSAEALICLAASNPEGQFFGIVDEVSRRNSATALAEGREVDNISFVDGSAKLPPLNYLCLDETASPLSASQRSAFFDLAAQAVLPGGLVHYGYRAYDDEHGHIRFLVREFGPEMSAEQAQVFLTELKDLGGAYFAGQRSAAARLTSAISKKIPDEFFIDYDAGEARSASFDTVVAMRPRGFSYAGDASIASNYIDLAVPPAAQAVVLKCVTNFLYEPVKDFALNRINRSDIWAKEPAERSSDFAQLFGGFSYGITVARDQVPETFEAQGKKVDLSSPLFTKLIDLMALMPISVGDFLSHPDGAGTAPTEIVGAIQILVACGLAQPMRGQRQATNFSNVAQPRFAGAFNRHLGQSELSSETALFASRVLGGAMLVPARDALVMQALDRGGLANSVSVLLPELQRIAQNPKLAVVVANDGSPTAESARRLIEDTVSRSIVQWYAYGLLEAA